MEKYRLTYGQALEKVNLDLKQGVITKIVSPKKEMILAPKYQVMEKPWDQLSLAYWEQFGISLPTLELFNVLNVKYVFNNKRLVFRATVKNPIFAYYHPWSGKLKIYRPLSPDKGMK